ncbi:MAG: hypothetical protein RMI91_04715 [Gemmatales bacterium]|nr:hypothetical protein [Gemmatales bacterium]MDW7993938.1 hypothetical protein [Gemmatales bacterium]
MRNSAEQAGSRSPSRSWSSSWWPGRWCGLVAVVVMMVSGCTREFFRRRADHDVREILQEKEAVSEGRLANYFVYPHPLARFADPTDPNFPPMPPDDPAAWSLAPRPQRPKAVAYIEGDGYLQLLEQWDRENRQRLGLPLRTRRWVLPRYAPITPPDSGASPGSSQADEGYIITLEQAVELGMLNSREFQSRREDLYLAALPVSLERFAFLPQFEATMLAIRQWWGEEVPGGPANRWRVNPTVGVRQLLPTGALLLLRLANQTVINLTGTAKHTLSQSRLTFSLAQPFLAGGGRAVTLEPLTQAERDLVYELRRYARFHREFYVSIAAGGAIAVGPADTPVAPVGYLPTLLRQQQLYNNERIVVELERELERFRNLAGGFSGISELQVNQVEQAYREAQSVVLQSRVIYANTLDQFKLQLGLPTEFPLQLDPSVMMPLRRQMDALDQAINGYTQLVNAIREWEIRPDAAGTIRREIERALGESDYVQGTELQTTISERWRFWQGLSGQSDQGAFAVAEMAAVLSVAPLVPGFSPGAYWTCRRPAIELLLEALRSEQRYLEDLRVEYQLQDREFPRELQQRLRDITRQLYLGQLELSLRRLEQRTWQVAVEVEALLGAFAAPTVLQMEPFRGLRVLEIRQLQRSRAFQSVFDNFAQVLLEARDEKLMRLEKSWPPLPRIIVEGIDLLETDEETALLVAGNTALRRRLDLMNRRAQLVDAWRQIAVTANALLGVVDLRYFVDVATPAILARPLDFEGTRAQHELSLNTELPLVRRLERNRYRAALIAFQRQRRALMAQEDALVLQIRQTVRRLRQLQQDYLLRQRALVLTYLQVNQAREVLAAPPEPGVQRDVATAAAALTQQLLGALRSLPATENALMDTWTSYLTTRMILFRDLEMMTIDERGVWSDERDTSPFDDTLLPPPTRLPEP